MITLEEVLKGIDCDFSKVSDLCGLRHIKVKWHVNPISVKVSSLKDDGADWNHVLVTIEFLRDAYDAQGYLVAKINSMVQGCK